MESSQGFGSDQNEVDTNILKFSLKRDEIPFVMEDATGNAKKFFLREMTGQQRDDYLNILNSQIRPVGGKEMMKSVDGLQAELLIRCIFDESNQPVAKKTVQSWRSSVVQALYERAQKMNGLGMSEEDKEKLKNG